MGNDDQKIIDEIIEENDEFNKSLLEKFYRGFLKIVEENTEKNEENVKIEENFENEEKNENFENEENFEEEEEKNFDTPRFEKSGSDSKRIVKIGHAKSLVEGDNIDDPNKNSTPFTYSKTSNSVGVFGRRESLGNREREGGENDHVKRLESIVVSLRRELEQFKSVEVVQEKK